MSRVVPHLIFEQGDEPCVCRKPKSVIVRMSGTEDDPLHLEGSSRQGPRVRRNPMCWKDGRMQGRDDVGLGKGRI